jgi:N-acyl-D-amino-acid deacylase
VTSGGSGRPDLVLRNGLIVDGTGAPGFAGDVAISEGRIVHVGPGSPQAREMVDLAGTVIAPGFIDMHSHADFTLPAYPEAINSLAQGVTTEVVGNCGWSPAPLAAGNRADEYRELAAGIGRDLGWEWTGYGSYLKALQRVRPAVNCVPLVGHHAVRTAAMGTDARPPTSGELGLMRELVRDAMEAGAFGLSTGLVYPPGAYAETGELIELVREVRPFGGIYASHIRNEGSDVVAAVEEAIQIAGEAGVAVQISHLKSAGLANRGRVRAAMERIVAARDGGVDAHFDGYPYEAVSTFLSQVLPPWVLDGGVEAMMEHLATADQRSRICVEMAQGSGGWTSLVTAAGGWEKLTIVSVGSSSLEWAVGRPLSDVAADRATPPDSLALEILHLDRGRTVMVLDAMATQDVRAVIAHPLAAIGSDQLGVFSASARVHPRAYGTFARVAGRFVREGVLTLEGAIHKMTGMPASIMGLPDRGRLVPGAVADITVFDLVRFEDRATYREPTRPAAGLIHVLMGGRFAVRDGAVVDARLGSVLRPARLQARHS